MVLSPLPNRFSPVNLSTFGAAPVAVFSPFYSIIFVVSHAFLASIICIASLRGLFASLCLAVVVLALWCGGAWFSKWLRLSLCF